MPLNLSTKFTDNIYVLHCDGAITLGPEATALEAQLERCSHATAKIILNLAKVHRLDSMGLGLIVRHMAALRKRGGDLRLSDPSPFVASLLDHTMLTTVLRSYPTDTDALSSFQKSTTPAKPQQQHGRRVLLIDSSPDLCAFVRTILSQHGFDIRSIGLLRDAKTLLRSESVDFLLIGPSNPHITDDIIHQTLGPSAPKTTPRRLSPDFKTTDAHQATATLLNLFGFTP
ncbi:MAG: STAS domain-containing protein [Acidobacteriaceae bacterium]